MKKILLIFTLALAALAGCEKESKVFTITPEKSAEWAGGTINIRTNREVVKWSHELVIPKENYYLEHREVAGSTTSISESGLVTLGMYEKPDATGWVTTDMVIKVTAESVNGETATCEITSKVWQSTFFLCGATESKNPEAISVGDLVCLRFSDVAGQPICDEAFLDNVKMSADNGKARLTALKLEGNHLLFRVEKLADAYQDSSLDVTVSYGALSIATHTVIVRATIQDFCAFIDDTVFKDYCLQQFDTDNNGAISREEADAIESIDISNLQVKKLNGIENFTNLKSIRANKCPISELVIPSNLESLAVIRFGECAKLKKVTIPGTMENIYLLAFAHCYNLIDVSIDEGVKSVGMMAFQDCRTLMRITLPSTIESIGDQAFHGCTNLETIYCKPKNPPLLGDDIALPTNEFMKIYVPRSSYNEYTRYSTSHSGLNASHWCNFEQYIIAYDF